jgi:hypothetical protein
MNEKKYWCPEGIDVAAEARREKKETLRDKVLISAWVTAYAGLLLVFRVAKSVEMLSSNTQKGAVLDRGKAGEKTLYE